MTPQEMWNAYKKINPSIGDEIDAWAFGFNAAQPPRPQQFALERIFGSAVRNDRICFKSSLFSRSGHGRKIFCSSMILFPSPSSCNFS